MFGEGGTPGVLGGISEKLEIFFIHVLGEDSNRWIDESLHHDDIEVLGGLTTEFNRIAKIFYFHIEGGDVFTWFLRQIEELKFCNEFTLEGSLQTEFSLDDAEQHFWTSGVQSNCMFNFSAEFWGELSQN